MNTEILLEDRENGILIQNVEGCVLVSAPKGRGVPVDLFSTLMPHLEKGAVLDLHVARLYGAMLAAGSPEKLEILAKNPEILDLKRAEARQRFMGHNLPDGALEWYATGHHGESSIAIFEQMTDTILDYDKGARRETPQDAAHFARCEALLDMVPEWRSKTFTTRMSRLSSAWKRLAARWDALSSMHGEIIAIADKQDPYRITVTERLTRMIEWLNAGIEPEQPADPETPSRPGEGENSFTP